MALQTKAKWAQLRVGVMALVALGILGYLIWLLSGSQGLFRSRSEVYTYLPDSAAIAQGADVRLNGILVGRVLRVGLSGSSDPKRVVKATLQVDDDFLSSIPVDSMAQITAGNLLATKYINITKGRSAQTIKPGAELASLNTAEFEDLVQQGYSALGSMDAILKKADGIIDQVQAGHGTIGKLLVDETLYSRVLAIADESQKLMGTLNSDQGTIQKLLHDDRLYDDVRGTVTRINTLLDGIDQGQGTAGQLLKNPALYDDTRKTIADVRQILAGIDAGQGTVGKLLKSDDLHNQIQATIGRLDTMLDKINSGQGTLGQLLVNPQLYETIDGTTRELHGLLQDFRKNPKKFLRIQMHIF
jgi:phospholipid/cholesterol/gamma-HCH transport system substrate-binding protein